MIGEILVFLPTCFAQEPNISTDKDLVIASYQKDMMKLYQPSLQQQHVCEILSTPDKAMQGFTRYIVDLGRDHSYIFSAPSHIQFGSEEHERWLLEQGDKTGLRRLTAVLSETEDWQWKFTV